jgi:aminopeptidase N
VDRHLASLATACAGLAAEPEHRLPALRVLAACASTEEHLALLAEVDDVDLAWRVLARRAELGGYDADAVAALAESDPDPDSWVRALGVRAARPEAAGKEEAFEAIFTDRTVPAGRALVELGQLLWRPGQDELLRPWTTRYLTEVVSLGGGGMLALGGIIRHLFPYQNADAEFLARVRTHTERDGLTPVVRSALLTGADSLERMLRQRSSAS